jgi:hypothetical protein
MAEVMIPPWVRPESPETIRMIDDATLAFAPAFGRGTTQRGIWADPRWGLRRRYRGLRSDEKASILNALNETRGQLNVLRVTPHTPLRGSFPAVELFTNNTFASGTTGWLNDAQYTVTVSDRIARLMRNAVSASQNALYQNVTLTQYLPYVARAMTTYGQGTFSGIGPEVLTATSNAGTYGYRAVVHVPLSTGSIGAGIIDGSGSGLLAGDYFHVPWLSLARCAVIDGGVNVLLQSDTYTNAAWTKTRCSAADDVTSGPDGLVTIDAFVEDTSNNTHLAVQGVAGLSAAAADWTYSVYLKAGTRTWAAIQMVENTAGGAVTQYINLSTGALGSGAAGSNWSNLRAFVEDAGNGWYIVSLVARKTNAATSITAAVYIATGNNVSSYTGDGSSFIRAGRSNLSPSSFPGRLSVTTSVGAVSTSHGSGLYVKGLPSSTNGLLEIGDWCEISNELKQVTARLNSGSTGRGYIQYRPTLAATPADNDPVIIQEPFGRFIYPQGTRELENLFGIYGDCTMDLEELYV